MASEPEGTEQLNYQTWVLKVSVHCEGCKKKLKKILHKVNGVHSVEIDATQNRVTVAGTAAAESLIQQLLKYGKHAEILPEKKIPSDSAAPAAKKEEKTEAKGKEKVSETGEKEKAEQGKAVESPETPPAAAAASDETPPPKPDTDSPSQPEKNDSDGKRKGKEAQEEESRGDARELNSPPENYFPANFQPVYTTVSYQMAHPSTSYAYYAAPPPEMSSSYAFYGNAPPPEYYYSSESYYGSVEQSPPAAATYDMFNDENPNACKLM